MQEHAASYFPDLTNLPKQREWLENKMKDAFYYPPPRRYTVDAFSNLIAALHTG
jgi:hypothetical protein